MRIDSLAPILDGHYDLAQIVGCDRACKLEKGLPWDSPNFPPEGARILQHLPLLCRSKRSDLLLDFPLEGSHLDSPARRNGIGILSR
jgi:hypothetical protein